MWANPTVRRGPSSRVPDEFRGRARSLRDRIKAEDAVLFPQMHHAGDKIRARAIRNPIPRRADMVQWELTWQRMPALGRLLMLDTKIDKGGCSVIDVRAIAALQHHSSWGEPEEREPCLAIVGFSEWFTAAKLRAGAVVEQANYERMENIRCSISFHCLARAFERWRPTDRDYRRNYIRADDHNVLAAMLPLSQLHADPRTLCDARGHFEIPAAAADRCFWYGEVCHHGKDMMLVARTFKRA